MPICSLNIELSFLSFMKIHLVKMNNGYRRTCNDNDYIFILFYNLFKEFILLTQQKQNLKTDLFLL